MNSLVMQAANAGQCANCRASVAGNYCQQCGQETVLHPASAREFLHEFVGHYVALEGKLWRSLALLLFRPGRLTREYIEGRRVRYVQPLRVYLTFSIIFFALFKFGDISVGRNSVDREARAEVVQPASRKAASDGEKAAADAREAAPDADAPATGRNGTNVSLTSKSKLPEWVAARNPALGAKVLKFLGLPKEELGRQLAKGLYSYVPYAMFLLMPVFALWLKLLYLGSGRRYGEHLLFALHTNAFAFASLSLILLTPNFLWQLEVVLGLWLCAYLPMAMRRVYGGSRKVTVLRWLVLMLLHFIGFLLAIAAALALIVMLA